MSTPLNQTPQGQNRINSDPELKDLLDLFKKDIFLSLNCHALATVQSFDKDNQTVSATINYKKTFLEADALGNYTSVLVDYPVLLDCPVIVMQGGGGSLTFPIAEGDTCLILFNDRDIDNWFGSGQIGPLASQRLHSFSDGIALIGLRPASNPIEDYDDTRVVLQNGSTKVAIGESKVEIANATTTLNTLLQNLITILSGLTTINCVPGAPVTLAPAVITQLTTLGTQLGGLLE